MPMDYDFLSLDYDITRKVNIDTVKSILSKADIVQNSNILDFGCGTGNYTCAIRELTKANVYGVEPSDGMRQKAIEKNKEIEFKKGDHSIIPFEDSFFDLIYMTDVIHHVPDIGLMFAEFYRTLKTGGLVCILTESHKQIENRFWSSYFPATVAVEKKRYPDISVIISTAEKHGFILDENINSDTEQHFNISEEFIGLVENKGYSMFRLIDKDDFSRGLKLLKKDYENNVIVSSNHGETFLWLKKV